jgi:hypothetical protein
VGGRCSTKSAASRVTRPRVGTASLSCDEPFCSWLLVMLMQLLRVIILSARGSMLRAAW